MNKKAFETLIFGIIKTIYGFKNLTLNKPREKIAVVIKHVPSSGELYVGHNTWHVYAAMGYRILKKYNFPFRLYYVTVMADGRTDKVV